MDEYRWGITEMCIGKGESKFGDDADSTWLVYSNRSAQFPDALFAMLSV